MGSGRRLRIWVSVRVESDVERVVWVQHKEILGMAGGRGSPQTGKSGATSIADSTFELQLESSMRYKTSARHDSENQAEKNPGRCSTNVLHRTPHSLAFTAGSVQFGLPKTHTAWIQSDGELKEFP